MYIDPNLKKTIVNEHLCGFCCCFVFVLHKTIIGRDEMAASELF